MELTEFLDRATELADKGDIFHARAAMLLRDYPVGIREFVESPDYLDDTSIYPANMASLEALNNPGGWRIGTNYVEAILTGAIGTGKTTVALHSTLYQVYVLACLKSPHALFGLSESSEIAFILQAPTERLAKNIGFNRIRELVLNSKCFKGPNAPDKRTLKSQLAFPNGVVIRPLTGSTTAALGANVMGGLIDELAFAEHVQNSMRTRGLADEFDQGEQQYLTIQRRRKSRFLKHGRLPGLLCLVSSPQAPDDLMSRKLSEATTDLAIYVHNKRLWDVRPDDFGPERFKVFCGDENRPPRILADKERISKKEADLIDEIPEEFRREFTADIDSALRDIAGRASTGISPFMRNRKAVLECFKSESLLAVHTVDFSATPDVELAREHFPDLDKSRWAHVDLALSRDSAGVACGYIQSFREVEGILRPVIVVDFTLEVVPPEVGEINFSRIRQLLIGLRNRGLPIKWVSFDGFQSADSRQILAAEGFAVGLRSMDKSTQPYETLREAMYESRVIAPPHVKLQKELVTLQFDVRRQKVDHPVKGSKDIADALAGVVAGLSIHREARAEHGVYGDGAISARVTNVPNLTTFVSTHNAAVDELVERFEADTVSTLVPSVGING